MYEGKNHFYLHAENQNSFFVVVAVLVFHHCDSFGFVAMSSRLKSIWWTKKKKIQLKMIRFYHQPQNQWWAKQIKWNVAELFRFSSVFSTSFFSSQFVRFCIPFENIFGIFLCLCHSASFVLFFSVSSIVKNLMIFRVKTKFGRKKW